MSFVPDGNDSFSLIDILGFFFHPHSILIVAFGSGNSAFLVTVCALSFQLIVVYSFFPGAYLIVHH